MKLQDIFKLSTIQDLQNFLNNLESQYAETIYQQLLKEWEEESTNIGLPKNLNELKALIINEENIVLLNKFTNQMNIKVDPNQSLNISNITALIPNISKPFNIENIEAIKLFLGFDLLFKTVALAEISFREKKLITNLKEYHKKKYFNKKTISQSNIALEWGIDNDTLSSWFISYYGENVFFGRKKLNVYEYIEIHRNFFNTVIDEELVEQNLITSPDNMEEFISIVTFKGKVYEKKDIIEIGFNLDEEIKPKHYEQAKIILEKKFPCYSDLNKFYHSIAIQMIAELKK